MKRLLAVVAALAIAGATVAASPQDRIGLLEAEVAALRVDVERLKAIVAAPSPTSAPSVAPASQPAATPSPARTASPPPASPWVLAFDDTFDRTVAKGQFTAGGTIVRWTDRFGASRTAGTRTADGRYIAFGTSPTSNWPDTSRHGTYADSSIIEIRDGKLIEHVYADANGYGHTAVFTPLPTGGSTRGGIVGGRSLIRARADTLPGFKGVFLWWADAAVDNDMLTYGEIDGPEGPFNETPDAFMHFKGGSSPSDQKWFPYPDGTRWTDYHDYVTEWIPGKSVEYFIDGTSIGKVTERIPTDAAHFNAQPETNTGSGPWPAAGTAGVVEVDRIAVWRYAP